jgi:hypothetical protein
MTVRQAFPPKPPSAATLRQRRRRARQRLEAEQNVTGADNVTPVTRAMPTLSRLSQVIGVTLAVTGVTLAAIGMLATTDYSMRTADGADRLLLAALAIAADLLTLTLPAASAAVWHAKRRGLAAAAAVLWIAAAAVTAMNLAGFISVNGDAFLAGRQTASTERALVIERIGRLRAERASITETRPVGAIVVAIRNATKAEIDGERTALAIGRRRDQLDAELAAIEPTIPTLPAVDAVDPSAAAISGIIDLVTDGRIAISDEALARARVLLLLMLPMLAGMVLALGTALAGQDERA